MSCVLRLVTDNYAFDETVSLTATSSAASFPVSNLRKHHRSREWRSSGYFLVTADNKYLDFAEAVAGTEITATITEGEYTATTLAAEIKSALEAVGAETYTVSYNAVNGYWTIAHAGTALELRSNTGTNAASSFYSSLSFDVSSDYTGAITYTSAAPAIHTEEVISFDLYTAEPIDSFAIVYDPRIGSALSGEAVVTLQGSATNIWDTPGVSQVVTFDDSLEVYQHFFSTPQEYRYWRVKIVDPKNPNLYVNIGQIILGAGVTLDHGAESKFDWTISDQSKTQSNEYGYQYADVYPSVRALGFNLNFAPQEDLATLHDAFDRVGNVVPVYVCLDSFEDVLNPERFSLYGFIKGDLKAKHVFLDNFDTTLTIEEAI